jgi:hypothetical protein
MAKAGVVVAVKTGHVSHGKQEADTLVTVPEPLAPDCAVHVFVAMQTFSPYVAPNVVTKYC